MQIKYMLNRLIILFITLTLLSCTSSKPISSIDFKGVSNIKKGEIAQLNWNFKNANAVKVDKYSKLFAPKDSVKVAPDKNAEYKITAFHETDTVAYTWKVNVIDEEIVESAINETYVSESIEETEVPYIENKIDSSSDIRKSSFPIEDSVVELIEEEFIKGQKSDASSPNSIKILNSRENNKELEFRILVKDKNDNYISGITSNDLDISFLQYCQKSTTTISDIYAIEKIENQPINLSILFDNSYFAEFNFPLLERILNFSEGVERKDNLKFSYFNNEYSEYIDFKNGPNFYKDFRYYNLPSPFGLNALNKALFENLNYFAFNPMEGQKSIILISYGEDNHSNTVRSEDIIDLANNFGVSIYAVSIGSYVDNNYLNYLCRATGGILYELDEEKSYLLENILIEIYNSHNRYYHLKIDFDGNEKYCNNSLAEFNLKINDKNLKDGIIVNPTLEKYYMHNSIIATYDKLSSNFKETFSKEISNVSEFINQKTDYKIMLIGHSYDESDYETETKLAEDRAQNIKKLFLESGVSEDKIIVKSEASNRPRYLLAETPWQNELNRRVEIKIINPESADNFELIISQVWTEESAIAETKVWKKRGYKVYYEPALINKEPVYRVKLWGYNSKKDALTDAKFLNRKYKTNIQID